ncbi:ribosome biogenesis protein YTM1 [Leucogyrophana mollusca]|uniref:Ribosome biogenesis protein YTM1 n=1 Tax=Leucogyrophana mollusca TaxID=85980 RepID=A0ACB8B8X0_9AGAM|nr:ribosome biogenesis protein YTM1 [Leucogyrophana mollusca]
MASHPVVFTTKTPYPLPSQKFMIPLHWKRFQLSQLINKALSLPRPVPFDFLIRGADILRGTLGEWTAGNGVGEEDTLEIEYFESVLPPQRMSSLPHEDWVSSISSQIPQHILTASYDGHIRLFDYSQSLLVDVPAHGAAITSACPVPSSSQDAESSVVASASHDLTARLTRISLSPSTSASPRFHSLASLHLHTLPLSSISPNTTGTHLLTASWDGLIGLWDTNIPDNDDPVPLSLLPDSHSDQPKKKRKVTASTDAKRKVPLSIFKSHTNRVSKALFSPDSGNGNGKAYSCGFDSTVRTWDVEMGVCVDTITAPEKPFLDLALTADGHIALAASTDRSVSIYDLRSSSSSLTNSIGALTHPATVSCIVPSSGAPAKSTAGSLDTAYTQHQLITGAYDGIARLWDLRSTKAAVAVFKVWHEKKILSVDWVGNVVSVGGEDGVEMWKVG